MSTTSTNSILSASADHLAAAPNERSEIQIHGIRSFIDRHAVALYDTLDAAAGETGTNLLEDLVGVLSTPWPNSDHVLDLLGRIRDLLSEASFERLDKADRERSCRASMHDRVRWFGARLTDMGC
ncbi:hypothetical protein [Rubellimicrobium aerolatum]|uniref:Uncharacterized protein n=1 Tax=Rubellimicrobium aerolatum TaxID=490979 RepID=A0ABW0S8R9_9RHOB|nr:hypothetical protein [Rubellimicrobium aerolatum]MBP1804683.1 hypothetical protein [Rubellimicrobium aerolatum]